MDIFNNVLFIINNIIVSIIGFAFTVQLIYILLFFVRAKRYPVSEEKRRIGIVIPARNEEAVIADTIKCILGSDYPKDKFDVYVVADNCTDNTAAVARAAGATVFERSDPDPKHRKAGYALKYLFEKIMEEHADDYELFIKFDADNLMERDYISRMNDAYAAGVRCARGYSNSKNIDQNIVTGISGLWYIRDCRFACNFRSAIGTGSMLGGAGMMFAADIIKKHGWDCLSASDDTEFTMRRLNQDKIKTMYVKEAVVYEDQPSSIKDTFSRYKRMARALNSLFYTQGIKSLGLFFVRWNWTYIDLFVTLLFIPACVMCCLWLPLYYGYDIIYHYCIADYAYANRALINVGLILAFAFVLAFIVQALIAVFLERKRIKCSIKKLMPAVLLFPGFMIIYAAAITIGVFSKPKWRQIKRNITSVQGLPCGAGAEVAATESTESTESTVSEEAADADNSNQTQNTNVSAADSAEEITKRVDTESTADAQF